MHDFSNWRGRALLLHVVLVAVAVAWAQPVMAQARDTGTLAVRAIDPDGAALPGVMVVATGPTGTRTQHTGIDGTARFPGLPPGEYSAAFTLSGFNTVIRENLRIGVGRTVSVAVTMELSTIEETITVTGESPLVDVKNTNIGSLYSDELIEMAPTASGLWAGVLDHVPGIVQNTFDVGGAASGSQSLPEAYGSDWNQNSYTINGANATDPAAIGATSYFSTHAFEEVGVATAGHDLENQTPGVMINMVVKSGSNDWHGGAKFFYENDSLVSNNVKTEELRDAVGEGNPNTYLGDLDLQVGGPILKDRAWFFVDYWDFETRRILIGVPEEELTSLEDWTISGTYQLNDNHKATARWISNRKFLPNRGASANNPLNGFIQDFFMDIPQLQWQGVFGGNAFADVRFAKQDIDFPLTSRTPGSQNPHDGFQDQPAMFDNANNRWVRIPAWRSNDTINLRDTSSVNGAVSYYITGENHSHDIKAGAGFNSAQSFNPAFRAFGLTPEWEDYEAGLAERVTLYASPAVDRTIALNGKSEDILTTFPLGQGGSLYKHTDYNLFAQDTWTIGNRLTITGGVRLDSRWNWNPEQGRQDSFFPEQGPNFQAATLPKQPNAVEWTDLTPRIGVVYDLFGDGRTALKANYARYSDQLGVTEFAGTLNANGSPNREYEWSDLNGDGLFSMDELGAFIDESIPGVTSGIDPDAVSPISNEFTGGLEHELVDNLLVSGTFIWRKTTNLIEGVNVGRPYGPILASEGCAQFCTPGAQDPYVSFQVQDPGPDGEFGTADDGGMLTVWARRLGLTTTSSFFVTGNAEKFGLDKVNQYVGGEFVMTKRWADNWQMLASYNIGKAESNGNLGNDPQRDFDERLMRSSNDRTHMVKVTGNYLIAEPIGVNLGMYYRFISGQPMKRDVFYGRSFLEAASGFDDLSGSDTVVVEPRGDVTNGASAEPGVHLFDFRAEKQVTIGRFGILHGYLDVFNAFNINTSTSLQDNSGSSYLEIFSIVPPRVVRIGAAWDF